MSGKVLDESAPIPLGEFYSYAFAPDDRTLAVVSAAQLYLIDLPSWEFRSFDIGLHGALTGMVYSPNGTLLAIVGADPKADLRVVDAATGEVIASAEVGFAVRNIRFTQDGTQLMLYGPHLAAKGKEANAGVSVGAPQVALLSAPDLRPLWLRELNGLRDGAFPKQADTPDIYQPGAAWYFSPAIAFAPNANVLYAVHGDEDRLTIVDFSTRHVKTRAIHAQTSLLDRLLAWTAGVAYAKGMDGTTKLAAISPDGSYLYVVGQTVAVTKPAGHSNWDITVTSTGLELISVPEGALIQKVDSSASSVRLAPDGAHLLLQGWDDRFGAWTDVYDVHARSVVKHLSGLQLVPARRVDGAASLQAITTINTIECGMALVDAGSWTVTASWKGRVCSNWLVSP